MGEQRHGVVVVGGGHAGAEAAWAAARLGVPTGLVTLRRETIGRMSCNPAIGGIGKGQMVREIDALGGLMGLVADETGIQFRMLNRRKGPALWAPRSQNDRQAYAAAVCRRLQDCPGLTIIEAEAVAIETAPLSPTSTDAAPRAEVRGVRLHDDRFLQARAVIVTSGTFLNGLLHTGEQQVPGGRIGEAPACALSASLRALGLRLGRLKTGTPPRVHRDSVDFGRVQEQPGDPEPVPFSFLHDAISQPQVPCWITSTNPAVHELIRANLHRAPLFTGQIQARGPRYCPSIEDKVVRFPEKEHHQVFLEPEGRDSEWIYVNGVSTSLPVDVQQAIIRRIPGLENARILQWGYAVEYDFVPPEQLDASLMTKAVRGLFLAGQINGTSGYEEAAGQGLITGVNAARFASGRQPVTLGRDEAYIGVMIDDLVTRGVVEPYRMFTSRAEHRMHLRYDNADARLTPIGRRWGLVDDRRWARFERKTRLIVELRELLARLRHDGQPLVNWLKRPEEDGRRFAELYPPLAAFQRQADVWAAAVVDVKYAGYLDRERRAIERFRELENRLIPDDINFRDIKGLRYEAMERWSEVRPRNVGQAARVSGIQPTDVTVLLVELARRERAAAGGAGR